MMPIGASEHRWIKLTHHRVADDAVFEAIGQITLPKRGVMQEFEIGQPKDCLTVLIRQLLKFPDDPHTQVCFAAHIRRDGDDSVEVPGEALRLDHPLVASGRTSEHH